MSKIYNHYAMEWMCKRCGYKTTCKSNLLRHFNRKKLCPPTKSDIERHELQDEIHVSVVVSKVIRKAGVKKVAAKKSAPKQKQRIPVRIRELVWNTYIGKGCGASKCICCGENEITPFSFHCGHVVAEARGGSSTIDFITKYALKGQISCEEPDEMDYEMANVL